MRPTSINQCNDFYLLVERCDCCIVFIIKNITIAMELNFFLFYFLLYFSEMNWSYHQFPNIVWKLKIYSLRQGTKGKKIWRRINSKECIASSKSQDVACITIERGWENNEINNIKKRKKKEGQTGANSEEKFD